MTRGKHAKKKKNKDTVADANGKNKLQAPNKSEPNSAEESKHKLDTPQEAQPPPRTRKWHILKMSSLARRTIGVVLGILTLIGIYYNLRPKLSCSVSEPLLPSNPFSANVTISNDGYLPIHEPRIRCGITMITLSDGNTLMNGKLESFEPGQGPHPQTLNPGQKTTHEYICGIEMAQGSGSVVQADIIVIVSYRADFCPWDSEFRFPYFVTKNENGRYLWIEK